MLAPSAPSEQVQRLCLGGQIPNPLLANRDLAQRPSQGCMNLTLGQDICPVID